jgi:hypothetical protein
MPAMASTPGSRCLTGLGLFAKSKIHTSLPTQPEKKYPFDPEIF